MLLAEPADFFCFHPSLVTFWGTLVDDAKIVHFTFYVYFPRALRATMFFEGHDGAPVRSGAGAERVRKLTYHWSEGSLVRKVWNSLQLSDPDEKTPAIFVTLKVNTLLCTIHDIF